MNSDNQLSLFDNSEFNQRALIPTDAKIPIPSGTYSQIADLAQHCNTCVRCALGENRTHAVVGRGNLQAKIMIIGEAPGKTEDETGLPFVGRSGQLLEKILASVELTTENDVYIANINKCLEGDTKVLTKQGYKQLNWIVESQSSEEVLSVENNGNLVWKKITGWYKSKLAGRQLYQVCFKNNQINDHSETGYIATADHQVLTHRGWVTIEELQDHDLVATGTPSPGKRSLQLLLGSLLGNAEINNIGHFIQDHSIEQQTYLKLKARVLAGFRPEITEYLTKFQNGNTYPSLTIGLAKTDYFLSLQNEWYSNGKKDFPLAALENLDNFGLAIWYMDNGDWQQTTQEVQITLGNITKEKAEQVVKYFENKDYTTDTAFNTTWKLHFRNNQAIKFLESIAQFVPASMRHKLPEELHCIPFNLEAYQEESVLTHWQPVTKKLLAPKPDSHIVYCIDVKDTANFITPAGVVHNCRPPENRVPTPDEIAACKPYLLEQIRLIDPKIILLTGATAVKGITGNKQGITKIRGQWIEWEGRLCMPIFHPSYLLRNPSKEKGAPKWLMWQDIQAVRAKYDEIRCW